MIETKYDYEKSWQVTSQKDLLKIIEDELGDNDPNGVLLYIKEVVAKGKELTIGRCKFRKKA